MKFHAGATRVGEIVSTPSRSSARTRISAQQLGPSSPLVSVCGFVFVLLFRSSSVRWFAKKPTTGLVVGFKFGVIVANPDRSYYHDQLYKYCCYVVDAMNGRIRSVKARGVKR